MSEERYHKMIAEVQDYAIILLDENGIVQNWNSGAEKIKGYAASEIVGRSFENFYTPEDRLDGLPKRLLHTAKITGKAVHEGWRVRKDGTRFWGSIVITALHATDGTIIGFSKVTRDLTQQKVANDTLTAYTRELEIQNAELEQFAYVASHDLQEPLRKIQTFTGLIQERFHDEKFVRVYLEKLDTSAKRLSQLVKALLDYSKVSRELTGKVHQHSDVDLNEVLAEVKQDFELVLEEKNAKIKAWDLPTVKGNKVQLGQLFGNLISNSLKFTKSEPLITITSAEVRGNEIPDVPEDLKDRQFYQITFRDNGIGFDQEYAKRIFVLFQRLHGKQEYSGTGIGLALCKKIVENHGGIIDATSTLNKGATFTVYLPV